MNKKFLQSARPLIFVFIFLNAIFLFAKNFLEKNGIDHEVLILGNLVLFLVSFTAFVITHKSLGVANPNAFVRAMYGSFLIKFFVVAIVAFIYIMIARKTVNKPGLLIGAGLYIVYTSIETRSLLKLLKHKKNA